MSPHNTPEKDQIPGDDPGSSGVGPKEILPGQEGRCSRCGEEIPATEPELVLKHPAHPGDDLYFHEGEACSELPLRLAEAYPEEWTAVLRLPTHWGLVPAPRDEELN